MMRRRLHGLAATLVLVTAAAAAAAGPEPFAIPVELRSEIDDFPGRIERGAAKGDVTIVEFVDYNCPTCRTETAALARLVEADGDIRLVTVVWPVLSDASAAAARVAAAARMQLTPARRLELHRTLLTVRGRVDGARARDLAVAAGADAARLDRDTASAKVVAEVEAAISLGDRLGFVATPAYIVHGEAYVGGLAPEVVAAMVAAVRNCDRTRC